jgi:hypothetical protein
MGGVMSDADLSTRPAQEWNERDKYASFLRSKQVIDVPTGFAIERSTLNPMLFDFQRDIVHWALKRGRAGIFADCGLGKTPMQLVGEEQPA